MATRNSTIVRACRGAAGAAVRGSFRVLDRVAPALGAWWAERIWFTIPRGAATTHPARPDGGAAFEVAVDGRWLRGRRWGHGDPVYLVHGWGGSGAQLDALVVPLVQAGFSVVSFDAPSHGASDPGPSGRRSSTILEFAQALRAVAARHGHPYGVVAHSAGATAAAVAALVAGRRRPRDEAPAGVVTVPAPLASGPLAWPVGRGSRRPAAARREEARLLRGAGLARLRRG
jgi:pimeloyl-ACP methyl ester carboxylesterase